MAPRTTGKESADATQSPKKNTDLAAAWEASMLTRRTALLDMAAAGMTARALPVFAKASQPATAVNFEVPANACDCHTHIHGDPAQFPFFDGRVYTPELALPE